ncbi:MAG: hypothetical protein LBF60_10240 [Treponema sp.]|jgi:hypothetical protein|nr:hypothetical protein [Treponema sp.]
MKDRNLKTARLAAGLGVFALITLVSFMGCRNSSGSGEKQSGVPVAAEATVAKTSAIQKSVSFTLTSGNTGTWKVYVAKTGGAPLTNVSADFAGGGGGIRSYPDRLRR